MSSTSAHAAERALRNVAGPGCDDRPVVIDFRTDANEKVFPMVAAGKSNDEIQVPPFQRGSQGA